MKIKKIDRSFSLAEILILYFSIAFIWELVFSPFYSKLDNVGFLASAASAVSMYLIAKFSIRQNPFFGRSLKLSDTPQIFFASTVTIFLGIGSWSLLVYLDALMNGDIAMKRWGLISTDDFKDLRWSLPWLIGHFLVSSLLAPIMEEIMFRGFILYRLRERYSTVFSVIMSAALFAAFHYDKSFIGAFIHGVIFAVLAVGVASIYAPILVHCVYNATIFTLTTCCGLSIVGDRRSLSHLVYWSPELLCGAAGCVLVMFYFIIFSSNSRMDMARKSG